MTERNVSVATAPGTKTDTMKYLLPIHFAFLLMVCLSANASAQSKAVMDTTNWYLLKDDYPAQSLQEKTWMFVDENKEWTIERLLAEEPVTPFHAIQQTRIEMDPGGQVVWLKTTVHAKIDLEKWWLILKRDNPRQEYLTAYDYSDLYFTQNGQLLRHAKAGLYYPASEKDIAEPVTVTRFWASFQKGETFDLYVRIDDRADIFPIIELRNPSFPIPSYMEDQYAGVVILSYFSFILGIYILVFFFHTWDRSYLYFFGMMCCYFLLYQVLHPDLRFISWFIPEHPEWTNSAWVIITSGSYIFFLEFGRTYANLRTKYPRLNRLMGWSTLALIFFLVMRLIPRWVSPAFYDFINGPFLSVFLLIPLIITIRLAFVNDRLVRHFVVAGAWLFLFSATGLLWERGIIPFFDFPNPWIVAQSGFMVIAALAIAYKLQISERAKSEVEKVKEIDSIKSRFFANISHEFRTPLSLILGPINQSLEAIPASEAIEDNTEVPVKGKHLNVMKRNALRLENLVNQILDLSKLDQGKMKLQVAEGDVIQFLRAMVFSFESLAERKHIHYRTHFPQSVSGTCFDQDKLEKIVVNLLSNAFKFTPEHGEVSVGVELNERMLKITIADSGNGMDAAEVAKIFDRFYQVEGTSDQGTGIGLSLVKELVELHRGQISVDSTEGTGTTFKVSLPYRATDFQPGELVAASAETHTKALDMSHSIAVEQETVMENGTHEDCPIVLIVEDNPDLRQYIAEQLQKDFQLLTAKDGKEGLKIAEAKLPDLIISDVMMPKMNGLELCDAIKTNIKTSHIPVILLTAKAGQDAKIEGLKTGADDYLTKPFDGRELLTRAHNLISQRAALREKFAGELKVRPTAVSLNSMDEQFIQHVMTEIEKNMGNEYYSVEEMAGNIGFSRSQLHRKLKGIIGKSPNQLIREFRLTRAKELLEQKSATVSEIAFEVGYSNLSYFSKSYKEAFGISPSEV